jgi:hypothetical protein
LGVLIDADENPNGRWQSFRSLCDRFSSLFPVDLPASGFIINLDNGVRLGFWMMPDCCSRGMMESFLHHLVPEDSSELWKYAKTALSEAKKNGANYRDIHLDKVWIHTWLAWEDPPGERLGVALMKKILKPNHADAKPFVDWFIKLYEL